MSYYNQLGFPGGSAVKNLPAMQEMRDARRVSVPGGENGNPLQYSCWKNPMDRGAWGATAHGVRKSLAEAKHTHNQLTIARDGGVVGGGWLWLRLENSLKAYWSVTLEI